MHGLVLVRDKRLTVLTDEELARRVHAAIGHPFEYTRGDPDCSGCQAEAALRELLDRASERPSLSPPSER